MADYTVFYSWQSDLPRKITRDLIHDAAIAAIGRIGVGLSLEDAPRLDQGTDGVSGIPAIGDTILGKIDQCGMFIADVSLVAKTTADRDGQVKLMPNPNVLFELGYAFSRIGWRRLILVMNTEFGEEKELPFDLRYRRFPFGFKVASDRTDIDKQRQQLSSQIEMALRAMFAEEHQGVTTVLKRLDGACRHFIREHSQHQQFWETDVAKNKLLGRFTVAIHRLLELGLIECVSFSNDVGYAYQWTYIGRLAIRRLGLPELQISQPDLYAPQSPQVITNLDWYDSLPTPQPEEYEGSHDHDPREGSGQKLSVE